jgi:DNA-binding transcriptional MerR regulator
MGSAQAPAMPTVGEIAQRLGVSTHRVTYVIDSRRIQPVGWAGNRKVYTEADVQHIASELARIERDRQGSTP